MKFHWTKQHTTALIYTCVTALAAALLLFLIIAPSGWMQFVGAFLRALSPLFIGFAIAYLLCPLCKLLEKPFAKTKMKQKARRILAVVLTFLVVLAALSLFAGMIVPQIRASYRDLEAKADEYLTSATAFANDVVAERLTAQGSALSFDREEILARIGDAIDSSFDYIADLAKGVLSFSSQLIALIAEIFIAFLFAIFFLYNREGILGRISSVSAALLPEKVYQGASKWIHVTDEIFGGFLLGKVVDSLIVAVINFAVFGLFGIPYYPLVALLCGVTNMIPYFGPIIGAVPSALLIVIASPQKALWFIILTVVIQQIDGNIIGPRILGDKLGIDSLTIILAITLSSSLFGMAGLFLGVPVFAVLYRMVKEGAESRLKKKGLPTETDDYLEEVSK